MVQELLKGVGHWNEQYAQVVFTPKEFKDYMTNVQARQHNPYDEYYQDVLLKGLAESQYHDHVSKEQLKKFLKDHKFNIGEQDINSIVKIIVQGDHNNVSSSQEEFLNEPIPFVAIKKVINQENTGNLKMTA